MERIADYLVAQHDAQYLLVTHRPQVEIMLVVDILKKPPLHGNDVLCPSPDDRWNPAQTQAQSTALQNAAVTSRVRAADVREGEPRGRVPIFRRLQGGGAGVGCRNGGIAQ